MLTESVLITTKSPITRRVRTAGAAALLCLVAACGSSDPSSSAGIETDGSTTTEAATEATTASTEGVTTTRRSLPDRATSDLDDVTTTTEAGAETTASTADPGSPIDFAPAAGTEVAVVGVQWDDTLNFRSGPGVENPVVTEVAALPASPPTILATGEAWQFPGSIWWEVTVDGEALWASQAFLGMLGAQTEITADVTGFLGSTSVETLEEAADRVAATRLVDTEGEIRIRHVIEPLMFEVGGRVIIDVLGYPDDALKGERLEIEVQPIWDESGDEPVMVGMTIDRVFTTPICSRGVSGGLCT